MSSDAMPPRSATPNTASATRVCILHHPGPNVKKTSPPQGTFIVHPRRAPSPIAFNRQNGDAFIPADAVHPSAVVRHRLYPVGSHQVMLPLCRNRHRSVQSAVDDLHRRADGRAPRKAQRRLLQRLADLGRGADDKPFQHLPCGVFGRQY